MRCKSCKREIPENSVFCNWCGTKQLKDRNETKVPKPRHRGKLWSADIMIDGHRMHVSAETEKEYYAKAAEAVKTPAQCSDSLGACIKKYIESNASVLSPSTIRGYDQIQRHRFTAYQKQKAVSIDYQKMINEEAKTVSAKSVKNAWGLVSASLRSAGVKVPDVNLPKVPPAKTDFLDHEQILVFLHAIKGTEAEIPSLLALHSLRASELFKLDRKDIDDKIHVRGATVRDAKNNWVDKSTNKNRTSTRDIPIIIPRLLEILPPEGRLVTIGPDTIRRQLIKVCTENGLPVVSLHDLRRSFATLCSYLGWKQENICSIGGWQKGSPIVNDIYIKVSDKSVKEDVQKMEKYLHYGKITSKFQKSQ